MIFFVALGAQGEDPTFDRPIPVNGDRVSLAGWEWLRLFVHRSVNRNEEDQWRVSEETTGHCIEASVAPTRALAIVRARKVLDEQGEAAVRARLAGLPTLTERERGCDEPRETGAVAR